MTEPDPADARAAATSRLALIGAAGLGGMTLMWFVFSLTYLEASVVDALGEALGGVTLLALILSIFGSLGQSR